MKLTSLLRFSVIDMLAAIASNVPARSSGMSASHSCRCSSQSTPISAQSAPAISISKPASSPRVVDVIEGRIVAHRADAGLPVGGECRPGYNREPGEKADREYDRCGSKRTRDGEPASTDRQPVEPARHRREKTYEVELDLDV